MPALFPWWTNSLARASLLVAALLVVGLPVALMAWVRTPFATGEGGMVAQPVPFDYRVHAHSLRVDCRFCHASVELAATAGVPPTTACVGCHTKALQESPTFAPVRASLASGRPIPWRRVNALPDFVYFDHSIHVAKGVGCESCHGRVDEMAQVSQATPLSMGWCVSCHRNPVASLRPRDEITTMGWLETHTARSRDSIGARLMHTNGVLSLTSCSTCHR